MNYLKELNAFIDWLEINPLDATTQALWFHLMAICNKSGWPDWFTVANLTLQAKLGVTDKTLTKHRNILIQKGRIEYKRQGTQKAGKYRIIPFESKRQQIDQHPNNVFAYYQTYISPVINQTVAEDISKWIDDLSEEIVIKAIDVAVEKNRRSWAYINGILREWAKNGLTTIGLIEAEQKRFREARSGQNAKPTASPQADRPKYNYGF